MVFTFQHFVCNTLLHFSDCVAISLAVRKGNLLLQVYHGESLGQILAANTIWKFFRD